MSFDSDGNQYLSDLILNLHLKDANYSMEEEIQLRKELMKVLEENPTDYNKIVELSGKLTKFDKDNVRFSVELPIPYGIQPTPWQGFNEYDPAYSLAMGSGMYDGEKNTDMIMNRYGWGNYAAFRCRQMSFNKYGGWYLPSLNELFVMYENKHLLTGLTDNSSLGGFYWTSTEASTSAAYMVSFYNGFVTQMDKSKTNFDGYPTILFKIRAVRRF